MRRAPATLLIAAGLALPARAHHLASPKVDLVHVSKKEIRIAVDYAVEPAKAGEMRDIFDRDRDGVLAAAERDAAKAWLRAAATTFLRVQVDGKKAALAEIEAEFRGLDGTGDLGALLVLAAPLALGAGPHRLELADRHKDAAIEVPVRVTFARGLETSGPEIPVLLGPQVPSLAIDFSAQ